MKYLIFNRTIAYNFNSIKHTEKNKMRKTDCQKSLTKNSTGGVCGCAGVWVGRWVRGEEVEWPFFVRQQPGVPIVKRFLCVSSLYGFGYCSVLMYSLY